MNEQRSTDPGAQNTGSPRPTFETEVTMTRTHAPCSRLARAWLPLALAMLAASPGSAQVKTPKTPLSQAVRAALAEHPPDTVLKRFSESLESASLEYEVDFQGLNALGLEYMQAGETEKGIVALGIASRAAQIMATGLLSPEVLEAAAAAQAELEKEQAQASSSQPGAVPSDLGPPRDDLERFQGLFASLEDGPQRALFVLRGCDGRLLVGPMWADVAPWTMRSVAETEFTWPGNSFAKPLHIKLILGPDGAVIGLEHDLEVLYSPLHRIGDLEKSFVPDCGRRSASTPRSPQDRGHPRC